MSKSESSQGSESRVVAVTKHGQATIPKAFREKLGIDAPGKVLFRENDEGEVIVERVPAPEEMRGFARHHGDSDTEESATERLREKRREERRAQAAKLDDE